MTDMLKSQLKDTHEDTTIGKGTWIDKLASEMITRERTLNRDTSMMYVESGLGASGIPHVGSIGDAVRAYGVKLALENLGYKSELVAYSDDLDGLRKVPHGLPEALEEHIAKPVSLIPDPYGCHDSYGMHMSSILLDGLDKLGVKYRFQRAKDAYSKGLFGEKIHTILVNHKRIGAKIHQMVGQEKYLDSLPYFPVCASCNRLYTAVATMYHEDTRHVAYQCRDATIGKKEIKGCGHTGEADIMCDLGKLAWKVEFAARWAALNIKFEAYGKDIMDSVKINDWVSSEVLGYAPPHHVKYEMFLDKSGRKISKSSGGVLTVQRWLEFGSPQSILLLLYKRITGAREIGLEEDVPSLMAEYDELEDIYFGKDKTVQSNKAKISKSKGVYEYANLLQPPAKCPIHISYRLLVELASVYKGEDRVKKIVGKLAGYKAIKESDMDIEHVIKLACRFADEFGESVQDKEIILDEQTKKVLMDIADALKSNQSADADDIQTMIYQTAKAADVPPKSIFQVLYQIILGSTKGPRIGSFIVDMGTQKVAQKIVECAM